MELTPLQAVTVGTVKAGVLHYGQVALFWIPCIAYFHYMGWWQRFFASMVVVQEGWYAVVITAAIYVNANFLLLAPANVLHNDGPDAQITCALYFLDPAVLLTGCISKHWINESLLVTPLPRFTTAVSTLGSLSALCAIVIGLFGDGVMFPSLLIGYSVVALSFPLAAFTFVISMEARI